MRPLLLSDVARPLRFACIGGITAVIQLSILELLITHGWKAIVANVIAFLLSAQVNFLLSSLFTWHDRRVKNEAGRLKIIVIRWLSFHGSIAGTALLNELVFIIASSIVPTLLASGLGIGAAALINFFVFNRFVFRRQPTSQTNVQNSGQDDVKRQAMVTTARTDEALAERMFTAMDVKEEPVQPLAPEGHLTYSIIAPVFNEVETLPHFYERMVRVMEDIGEPFELLLINDGSTDDSYTVMQKLHKEDARVRIIDFSRNFGHQIAISAGLDYARGDAVIIIDSDLQDPPEVVAQLIARWKDGAEVVYAQRTQRAGETFFKLATAAAFYRLISRLTSINIPRDTGDFRLLDRSVVKALISMREHHRFMRGLSSWVGFRQVAVQYERHERYAGSTKYPLKKMIRFSLDAITSFSYVPLQLATSFGFFLAGLSLIGILAAVILRIFIGAIAGQASTLILVLFMGGIQLIFLGIIGEYLGRIYDEVRARPLYIVREVLE